MNDAPIGTIIAYYGDISQLQTSDNWQLCDGRTCDKSKFPLLHHHLSILFGNSFDGNFPRLQGAFLRGADPSHDHDPGDRSGGATPSKIGSAQDDSIRAHAHLERKPKNSFLQKDTFGVGDFSNKNSDAELTEIETGSFGKKETRPYNICVNWLIKAK